MDGAMQGGEFFVEIKYDGDRLVMHKEGDKYMYHSRKGTEQFTAHYGDSPKKGAGVFTQCVCTCASGTNSRLNMNGLFYIAIVETLFNLAICRSNRLTVVAVAVFCNLSVAALQVSHTTWQPFSLKIDLFRAGVSCFFFVYRYLPFCLYRPATRHRCMLVLYFNVVLIVALFHRASGPRHIVLTRIMPH
jgi:hypothetical protein